MITIWNQREVFIGNPSQELKSAINILSENKIKYKCRVFSDSSAHFFNSKVLSMDVFNLNNDSSKIYYIYVHSRDYDTASALLKNEGLFRIL